MTRWTILSLLGLAIVISWAWTRFDLPRYHVSLEKVQ
jgi:hypothetical protein